MTIDELEKIEPDADPVNTDEVSDVFDVIDVTIERAFFFRWADQHGVNANDTAPFPDHFDLLIADVAFDIVIFSRVRV